MCVEMWLFSCFHVPLQWRQRQGECRGRGVGGLWRSADSLFPIHAPWFQGSSATWGFIKLLFRANILFLLWERRGWHRRWQVTGSAGLVQRGSRLWRCSRVCVAMGTKTRTCSICRLLSDERRRCSFQRFCVQWSYHRCRLSTILKKKKLDSNIWSFSLTTLKSFFFLVHLTFQYLMSIVTSEKLTIWKCSGLLHMFRTRTVELSFLTRGRCKSRACVLWSRGHHVWRAEPD